MRKKSLRSIAIASNKKMSSDIFFNKKKRKELEKTFLKTQRAILQESDFLIKPVLKLEYAKRALETSIFAFAVTSPETIKKAEEFDKKTYLTKCKFRLFKKGKSVVFKATFLKPLLDSKPRTSYFYSPQGLSENTKTKTFIYKDGKEFELKGYKKQDFGTFRQKMLDFGIFSLIYRGKKGNYKFKLRLINEEKQSYWATSLI